MCMPGTTEVRSGRQIPWNRSDCEPLCGHREPNLGSLQEQQILLIAELSLQLRTFCLFWGILFCFGVYLSMGVYTLSGVALRNQKGVLDLLELDVGAGN